MRLVCILMVLIFSSKMALGQESSTYKIVKSIISFHSLAPKEMISASSNQLKGAVDFEKGTFIFKVKMNSFEGFNNALQREHFNENYVESDVFPVAIFTGKIIENIDLNKNQNIKIRSKGKFQLHCVSKECIIMVLLKINNKKINASSEFTINLQEYNIKIPKVVYNKLAPEIAVNLNAQLEAL